MVRKVAKHLARNSKKYWRKISTKDIEDHQEDVQIQEITGGRRADQPDTILYHIDSDRPLGIESKEMQVSRPILKQRAALDLNNLNTYKVLKPHSSVPPPGIDSRQPKDPSSISTKRLAETKVLKHERKIATKKHKHAVKQRSEATQKNAIAKADAVALDDPHVSQGYDLWSTRDEKKEKTKALVGNELSSFMGQVANTFDWKVPAHVINKPSKLSAIEIPLSGSSYNPSYDDHQTLLQKAVDVEAEKVRKETKLLKQLPTPQTQCENAATQNAWLNEMASGLFDENWLNDPEQSSFPSDSVSVGKPVRVQPKTTQQRNKEKDRKKKEALAKQAKEKRIRDSTYFRVKSIRKVIDEDAREHSKLKVERKRQYDHDEKYATKKFGRYKFEEPDLDLNLSDEITGNLRTMKTEGNLLHDRFKSLQKRNVIESRIRAKPTKTKMKSYEKRSVREVGENYRPK